jgi:chromosome segregation ATPase
MIAGAEIGDLDAKIASLDSQIAERDAPLAEARERLRRTGGKALALLRELADDLSKSLDGAKRKEEELRRAGEALAARGAAANAALNDARKRAAKAAEELERHRRQFDGLVQAGHLGAGDDLDRALDEATKRLEAETAGKVDLDRRETGLRGRLGDAVRAVDEAETRLSDARKAVAGIEAELSAFGSALASARSLPSLLARFGDGVDIYAPGILPDFRSRRDQVTQRSRELAAENADFTRTIAAIDEHGLLPPPDEIERTLQALKKAGLNAHWAPRYLVQNSGGPAVSERRWRPIPRASAASWSLASMPPATGRSRPRFPPPMPSAFRSASYRLPASRS